MHYTDPARETDAYALPNIETFPIDENDLQGDWREYVLERMADDPSLLPSDMTGWYWWSCLPGCLPAGEPNGPFETEEEALADAREGLED